MTTKKDEETLKRNHAISRRKVYNKIRKRVKWNGMEFDSQIELGRYLKLPDHRAISYHFTKKIPLKGHLVERVKDAN